MNDDQFQQISDQFAKLNKRFDKNDDQFARIDGRFNESDDQFARLYTYAENQFGDIRHELSERASQNSVNMLTNAIDKYAGKIDAYAMEMAAMQHKIDRLEKYIEVLAEKAGVDLNTVHV